MRRRLIGASAAALTAVALAACGGSSREPGVYSSGDDRPAHIHGLAVVDGQVLAAAHNGLWNVGAGKATRVGDVRDDLMGFTAAGAGRYLASGHPARPGSGPPHLGLTQSVDQGLTWKNVSLPGQADFHALAVSGNSVYGYDSGRLLASADGGVTWQEDPIDAEVLSLAMRSGDEQSVLAGTSDGVKLRTRGRWKTLLRGQPALVSWPSRSKMIAVAVDGEISVSADDGKRWKQSGAAPGPPVAAYSDSSSLIVASEDGSISKSTNDGATWSSVLAADR